MIRRWILAAGGGCQAFRVLSDYLGLRLVLGNLTGKVNSGNLVLAG